MREIVLGSSSIDDPAQFVQVMQFLYIYLFVRWKKISQLKASQFFFVNLQKLKSLTPSENENENEDENKNENETDAAETEVVG